MINQRFENYHLILASQSPRRQYLLKELGLSFEIRTTNVPANYKEAVGMLSKLSGKKHEVITAVCLKTKSKRKTFSVISSVYFKELTMEEIDYYIENFQPFDKAGGYGIQEWIGYIGISKIEGSFFNIMGLPVKEFYEELLKF